jgi:hypothetical protein
MTVLARMGNRSGGTEPLGADDRCRLAAKSPLRLRGMICAMTTDRKNGHS